MQVLVNFPFWLSLTFNINILNTIEPINDFVRVYRAGLAPIVY